MLLNALLVPALVTVRPVVAYAVEVTPAASAEVTPAASGVGTFRCSKLTADVAGMGHQDGTAEFGYRTWAQGFLTALNVSEATHGETIANQNAMTPNSQWEWLRDYCAAHGDDLYMGAVASLAGHLKSLPTLKPAP